MSTFSIETFAADCKAAMSASTDRQAAAARCLEAAIAEHGREAILVALQAAVPPGASVGEMVVHASPELTMMFARVPARFESGIHDHTVFACIGQLSGREVSHVYEPTEDGLREVRTMTTLPGQVVQLPADVIHGIENPTEHTACALHLYGGDLPGLAEERSLWDAESHDQKPFSFPQLVGESIKTMHRSGNRAGLEAVAAAIPATRAAIDAL